MLEFILVATLSLIWGSFLNVAGYRLLNNLSIIFPNSFCPNCKSKIAIYDLIPVISWILLKARCRNCKNKISFLYPFIELLTLIVFLLVYFFIDKTYWPAYFIFISGLIVSIRTDFEAMLVSSVATLALIPLGFIFSYLNLLPINLTQSILGSILGYLILWSINKIFVIIKKQQAIGEGDFDLLATIGAFTGIYGIWISLFVGSLLGSIYGLIILSINKDLKEKIPFGPWLCFGAIIYILIQNYILFFLE